MLQSVWLGSTARGWHEVIWPGTVKVLDPKADQQLLGVGKSE